MNGAWNPPRMISRRGLPQSSTEKPSLSKRWSVHPTGAPQSGKERDKTPNIPPPAPLPTAVRPGSRLESCRAPLAAEPRIRAQRRQQGRMGTEMRQRLEGRGRDRTPTPRVRIGSARGMNHGQAAADPPPRLGNERIGSDSGPNRNVPPGVLSRPAKNPQATRTIRWSLVAGVLEFCRATRDSLLESCRANY